MKRYCIFQVWDYKGGELSANTNLTFNGFIANLSERFDGINVDLSTIRDKKVGEILDIEQQSLFDDIKSKVVARLRDPDFFSTYGGGDGFCGALYEVEGSKLKSVGFKEYVDDITNYIINNWSK